jgi:ABC-type Fe3+ transport system substrate-binding protein
VNGSLHGAIRASPVVLAVGTLPVVVVLALLGFDTAGPVVGALGWLLLAPLAAILARVAGESDGDAAAATDGGETDAAVDARDD